MSSADRVVDAGSEGKDIHKQFVESQSNRVSPIHVAFIKRFGTSESKGSPALPTY
jgi:hypothetical protein